MTNTVFLLANMVALHPSPISIIVSVWRIIGTGTRRLVIRYNFICTTVSVIFDHPISFVLQLNEVLYEERMS